MGIAVPLRWSLAAMSLTWSLSAESSCAGDWPQLQNGPQRQGYSPEKIDVPHVWMVMSPSVSPSV
jgi:hypothetical protein